MMGGLMYIAAGGKATFIEAFFVTFNLVANLTMSEMPNDLNHVLTLIYIFVFVTFGLIGFFRGTAVQEWPSSRCVPSWPPSS